MALLRSILVATIAAFVIAAGVGVFAIFSQRSTGGSEDGAPFATASATAASACRTFWAKSAPLRNHMGNDLAPPPSTPASLHCRGCREAERWTPFCRIWRLLRAFLQSPASVVGVGGSPDGSSSRTPSAVHPDPQLSGALYQCRGQVPVGHRSGSPRRHVGDAQAEQRRSGSILYLVTGVLHCVVARHGDGRFLSPSSSWFGPPLRGAPARRSSRRPTHQRTLGEFRVRSSRVRRCGPADHLPRRLGGLDGSPGIAGNWPLLNSRASCLNRWAASTRGDRI